MAEDNVHKGVTKDNQVSTPLLNSDQETETSILDSIVNSVKRKLNQSLSPPVTINKGKEKERSKVKPPVAKRARKGRGKNAMYNQIGDQSQVAGPSRMTEEANNSVVIEDYDTDDDAPLSGLLTQGQQGETDTAHTRVRALVKSKRFRQVLKRRGTPLKAKKGSTNEEIAEIFQTPTTADKAMKMLEDIQKNITTLTTSTESNAAAIRKLDDTAKALTGKIVTQKELEETVKKFTAPIQKKMEDYGVEIKRHNTEISKIEEELNAVHITLKSQETNLDKQKEHLNIVQAEGRSNYDELQRQFKIFENKLDSQERVSQQSHMTYAQAASSRPQSSEPQERSIILEGVHEQQGEDLDRIVFDVAAEMYLPLHDWEVNRIERLGSMRHDRKWPRPIRVEFTTVRKHEMFLKNKIALGQTDHYYRVIMRPDEPLEMRRLKGKLRKAVKTARANGKRAMFLSDTEVLIDSVQYNSQNIDQYLEPPRSDNIDTRWKYGGGCMMTRKGLAFYGAKSKLSSFYPCVIMRNGRRHETLEHGYQGDKALDFNDMRRYERIRTASTPALAKQIGGEIFNTPLWNGKKRLVMRGWLFEKYRQNPDLAEFLISTGDLKLIEASPSDGWWGSGAGMNSRALLEGTWSGNNILGEELEYVRSVLVEERKPWSDRMSLQSATLRTHPVPAVQSRQAEVRAVGAHSQDISEVMDFTPAEQTTDLAALLL